MDNDINYEPYRCEFEPELVELDSICEPVRKRISWVNRHLYCNFDPHGALLAFCKERLIGSSMMRLLTHRCQGKELSLGYLSDVAVHPEHQGKGLGKILSYHAIDFAHKKGADGIILFTNVSNSAAFNLYKKIGFIELTNQLTMVWNQQKPQKKNNYVIRQSLPQDKDVIFKLVRTSYAHYGLYSELDSMMFNSRGTIMQPGVSSYMVLDKERVVGSVSFLNFSHIWKYKITSGFTAPILLYNLTIADNIDKQKVFESILNLLGDTLIKASSMIVIMVDSKEAEVINLYQQYGFVNVLDGVWMGKSLRSESVLGSLKNPIYGGFPI